MLYVQAIIECLYRLTYMLVLKLINVVVFLKWEHVGFKIDKFNCIFEMGTCGL